VAEASSVRAIEARYRHKNGSWRTINVTGVNRLDDPNFGGIILTSHDVTERKKAERELRESEARHRALLENLPDFVLTVDRNATIQFVNHCFPHLSPEDLLGKTGFDFLVPERQEACRAAFGRALSTGESQSVEALDIFDIWWACRVVPLTDDGEIRYGMIICTDVTEQKRAEEAIPEEQSLLRNLLSLHERERQLVAYEIHDGVTQQLTGAQFNFEAYQQLRSETPDKADKMFETGVRLLRQRIGETRLLISGLRPPILDELGIVAAIEYLIHEQQPFHGPAVTFTHDIRFDRLAPPLESAIFRIVQESLTNACRHSHSDTICVDLSQREDRVEVRIRDQGVGFDPEQAEEHQFGVRSIRERARLLGGLATIDTAPGKGTCITAELPLIEDADSSRIVEPVLRRDVNPS